jgi:hypothetical protein
MSNDEVQSSNEKSASKNGMMEHWNIGFRKNIFDSHHYPIIPLFHYSRKIQIRF